MDPPPHQAPNPPGSKYCDGIFSNETRCGMTLEGETSVQEARDKVARALAEKLISGSGTRVIDINDWNVVFHPPVEDPAQTRLSGLKGERLWMIFSMTSSVPVLAQALHAADEARADKSVAEFVSELRREDNVKAEEDKRRLEKKIEEIRKTHHTEKTENTQQFKVQLEEQRKYLEDQMKKIASELRQENKANRERFQEEIKEARRTISEQGKEIEEARRTISEQGKEIEEARRTISEQGKELESRIAVLDKSVEEGRALTMLANPLLLRILMDDARDKIAEKCGEADWYRLKPQTSKHMLQFTARERGGVNLSAKTCDLIWDGHRYRDAGNHSAHNAEEPLIQGAIENLPLGSTRDAFKEMLDLTHDRLS